jgi:tetratricopeptide (TPR) repeat protein
VSELRWAGSKSAGREVEAVRSSQRHLAVLFLAGLVGSIPPAAAAFAEVGTRIEPVELSAVGGGKAPFLGPGARANVFIFFRTDQERSAEALKQAAGCEKELSGKGVHWVAVVSGSASPAEVKAVAAASGIQMPVLVDECDKLYDKLQIRLHPAIGIADGKGVIQAFEPYRQVDFGDVLKAQIRFVLGEIDRAALARALDPDAAPLPGDDLQKKAMRDVSMARRLIEIGQFEAAVQQAQKALEQAPVPAAFPVMGLAYAKLGRCPEAKKALDQAQKTAPDAPEIAVARPLCAGK